MSVVVLLSCGLSEWGFHRLYDTSARIREIPVNVFQFVAFRFEVYYRMTAHQYWGVWLEFFLPFTTELLCDDSSSSPATSDFPHSECDGILPTSMSRSFSQQKHIMINSLDYIYRRRRRSRSDFVRDERLFFFYKKRLRLLCRSCYSRERVTICVFCFVAHICLFP